MFVHMLKWMANLQNLREAQQFQWQKVLLDRRMGIFWLLAAHHQPIVERGPAVFVQVIRLSARR